MPEFLSAAATALVLATLPAGQGLPVSAPLDVSSQAPGAVAHVRFRDHTGAEREASCVTPCRLEIAQGSPFVLSVEKDGHGGRLPPVRWARGIWRTYTLAPASVAATFEEPGQ